MLHDMKLQDEWFARITSGAKTIELRLYDAKRKAIELGDSIRFTNPHGDTATFTVKGLFRASTFAALLDALPTTIVAGAPISRSEMLHIMDAIYSPEKQRQCGVLGIALAPATALPTDTQN